MWLLIPIYNSERPIKIKFTVRMKKSKAIILLSLVAFLHCPFVQSVKISGSRTATSSSSRAGQLTKEDPFSNSKEAAQGVITLNSRNFQSSMDDGNVWLVEFYSPWCGYVIVIAIVAIAVAVVIVIVLLNKMKTVGYYCVVLKLQSISLTIEC